MRLAVVGAVVLVAVVLTDAASICRLVAGTGLAAGAWLPEPKWQLEPKWLVVQTSWSWWRRS